MKEINTFSLEQHQGDYKNWPAETALFYDDRETGKKVKGFVIEAQFETKDHYFLINSFDCPYEESNEFILLDKSFKVLATESLCTWYSSFMLEDYIIKDDSEILLKYAGDFSIRLTLYPNKRGFFSKKIRYEQM